MAHWNQEHFVVVYKIEKDKVWVADPAHGKVTYSREEFEKSWASTVKDGVPTGVCLLLEPTPEFYNREEEAMDKSGFLFLCVCVLINKNSYYFCCGIIGKYLN